MRTCMPTLKPSAIQLPPSVRVEASVWTWIGAVDRDLHRLRDVHVGRDGAEPERAGRSPRAGPLRIMTEPLPQFGNGSE